MNKKGDLMYFPYNIFLIKLEELSIYQIGRVFNAYIINVAQ